MVAFMNSPMGDAFAVPMVAVFGYFVWFYPIVNGLRLADRGARSRHWLWLGLIPLPGLAWLVLAWIARGDTSSARKLGARAGDAPIYVRLPLAGLATWVAYEFAVIAAGRSAGVVAVAGVMPLLAGLWLAVVAFLIESEARQETALRISTGLIVGWCVVTAAVGGYLEPRPTAAAALWGGGISVLLWVASSQGGDLYSRTIWKEGRTGRIISVSDWQFAGPWANLSLRSLPWFLGAGVVIGALVTATRTLGFR